MAENTSLEAKGILAIDKTSVHRICSGQVVLNLATAVKELVENSVDAGATNIEIRLKDHGSELVEVIDNGKGVEEENFAGLTLKHHTSKLKDFSDLVNVDTFGFRGEALSSLCALSKLTIVTCHESVSVATKLEYDHQGKITKQIPFARQRGTTVSLENLFSTLPVRHKEFLRNVKREFTKAVQVLSAYCIISTGVRITCTNQIGKGKKNVVVNTGGNPTVMENITNIFGAKQMQSLLPFTQSGPNDETCTEYGLQDQQKDKKIFEITGCVSSSEHGKGRGASDRQFYFINKRPCDPQKISRLVNEVYHMYNKHQYPFVMLDISLSKDSVDVNVTPDKRQIFIQEEKLLLAIIKSSLIKTFEPRSALFKVNQAISNKNTDSLGVLFTRKSPIKSPSSCSEALSKKSISSSLSDLKRRFSSAFAKSEDEDTVVEQHSKQRKLDSFIIPKQAQISELMPGDSYIDNIEGQQTDVKDTESESQTSGFSSADTETLMNLSSEHLNITIDGEKTEPDQKFESVTDDLVSDSQHLIENSVMSKTDLNEMNSNIPGPIVLSGGDTDVIQTNLHDSDVPSRTVNKGVSDDIPIKLQECVQMKNHESQIVKNNNLDFTQKSLTPQPGRISLSSFARNSHTSPRKPQTNPFRGSQSNASPFNIKSLQQFRRGSELGTGSETVESDAVIILNDDPVMEIPGQSIENKLDNSDNFEQFPEDTKDKCEESDRTGSAEVQITFTEYDSAETFTRKETKISFSMEKLKKSKHKSKSKDTRQCRNFRAQIRPTDNQSAENELQKEISKDMFSQMKILGQFNLGFIITLLGQDLFIIDQHATDEKYNFEQLQKHTVIQSQKLIQPQRLELTAANECIMLDNLEIFHSNGFDFSVDEDAPSTQKIRLVTMPVSKNWTFGKDDIEELIFMLSDSPGVMCRPSRIRQMFASRACRKSVMIGTALNSSEMRKLVHHMGELDQPWNCPHGRPTMRHLINLDMLPD